VAVRVDFSGGVRVFEDLSKRLAKASAEDVVTRAVGDAIEGAAPVLEAAARGGAARLPKRGGLAAVVAGTRINRKSTRSRGYYQLRLVAGTNAVKYPSAFNRGRFGHPGPREEKVDGKRVLYFQDVPKGWFTEPMKANVPMLRARAEAAKRKALEGV
jgi:hypothetical protein